MVRKVGWVFPPFFLCVSLHKMEIPDYCWHWNLSLIFQNPILESLNPFKTTESTKINVAYDSIPSHE